MIKGLGIDITDIKKLKKILTNNKQFMSRVFSEKEIEYCKSKRLSMLHFAGRFAVKEAFLKAVSDDKGIQLKSIETINNKHGKPAIVLNAAVKKALKRKKAKKISISISHTENAAVAVCVIT